MCVPERPLLAPKGSKLVLTSDELKSRPDLCAIDGKLYDLHGFSQVHPGGEHILAAGAYDASAFYHSMHPGRELRKSELLTRFAVGEHVGRASWKFDSAFAIDLIRTVRGAMGTTSWYAPLGFWIRTVVICLLTLLFEYRLISSGSIIYGILVGAMHAQIGLAVQHDGSHGALSKNPAINAFFAYGADWVGNSRWIWFQQHILWHHPHTNVATLDPDARSAEPLLVFHTYSDRDGKAPVHWATRFQQWITHAVLAFYGPSVVYNPYILSLRHNDNVPASVAAGAFMRRQRPFALAMRAFYILRIVLLPWWIGGMPLYVSVFVVNVVVGVLLTFVFVVSHNFEGTERDPHKTDCWYKAQVETSCSYGGFLAMLLTGGLNFQIEHHIFPRLSSWHYPGLRGAVRDCCKRHGVKYTYYPSLWSNVKSMLKYMRSAGLMAVLQHAHEE